MFRNRNARTAAGAYEQPLQGGPSARGRQGFDPDDAWDSRVGHDGYGPGGYYEEQELGLAPPHGDTSYGGGSSYQMNLAATPGQAPEGFGSRGDADEENRGRSRGRSPGLSAPGARNPFDDDADPSNISLRGVSPRPIDTAAANSLGTGQKRPRIGGQPDREEIYLQGECVKCRCLCGWMDRREDEAGCLVDHGIIPPKPADWQKDKETGEAKA